MHTPTNSLTLRSTSPQVNVHFLSSLLLSCLKGNIGYTTRTILCMPVMYENTIVAVAELINKNGGVFSEKDESIFSAFAVFAGVTLRNAKLYEEVNNTKPTQQKGKQITNICCRWLRIRSKHKSCWRQPWHCHQTQN